MRGPPTRSSAALSGCQMRRSREAFTGASPGTSFCKGFESFPGPQCPEEVAEVEQHCGRHPPAGAGQAAELKAHRQAGEE
mmetsp:Transcript_78091/g.216710  ORF Transcript_78091/g.216710 Transcript_78091/m.216710 type:complete len:80 (-) Transcript_78091:462-701(-)